MEVATQIIAIVAIVLAVAAGAGLVLCIRLLLRYQRNQRVVMGSRGTMDIVEHVAAVDEKMANVRVALEDLTMAVRDHEVRIDSTLSRVGIVRFDAYQDLGGRQSTAVAFLNGAGDGVVITTVVSRDFARMYVKLIKDGTPDIPLAPEESEAVEQAKGSGPFTVRPRVGSIPSEPPLAHVKTPATSSETPDAGSAPRSLSRRELARENRRRRQQGLSPLEVTAAKPLIGWEHPETPSPQATSMAEEFVRRRRRVRTGVPSSVEPGDTSISKGEQDGL